MRVAGADPLRRTLLPGGLALAAAEVAGQDTANPLRALVVTIIMQDDFLPWLLADRAHSGTLGRPATIAATSARRSKAVPL